MAASHLSYFTKSIPLLILFLHLVCFLFPSSAPHSTPPPLAKKKRNSFDPLTSHKPPSSPWSFLKQIFSTKKQSSSSSSSSSSNNNNQFHTHPPTPATQSSSFYSDSLPILPLSDNLIPDPPRKRRAGSRPGSDAFLDDNPLSSPIPCDETFRTPKLLEQQEFTWHAVSELQDGDPGNNVLRIIFNSGWMDADRVPKIHRILKIHHSAKRLSRFEEYRESVKSRAAATGAGEGWCCRDERCAADGNELLRFHCTKFNCGLGKNANFGGCSQKRDCGGCRIIRSGVSTKMDGISTLLNSWRAHVAVAGDVEDDFASLGVKWAMVVCRVIAGRVGSGCREPGFDSVRRCSSGDVLSDGDELVVFNPRAVLPCFVVVYSIPV